MLESIPFDPERSPWDVTLIEGLENGRGALYLPVHHVLTDGLGGVRLLGQLLDDHEWTNDAPTTTEEEVWPIEREPSVDVDRKPGTVTITIDAPRVVRRFLDGVNRRVTWILSTQRCAGSNVPSMSPTRCPAR